VRPPLQTLPGQQAWFRNAPHAHSHPFALLPSQSPKPAMHVVNVHAPALHATPLAFAMLSQRFEHEPQ